MKRHWYARKMHHSLNWDRVEILKEVNPANLKYLALLFLSAVFVPCSLK